MIPCRWARMNPAEHQHPISDGLAVRPETRFRVIIGGAAVAVIVVCSVLGAILAGDPRNEGLVRPFIWVGVIALIALARTAGWHTLRSVRIDDDDLVLEHADRTIRRLPLADVGGLGYRGTSFGGRLFDGFAWGGAVNAGRLVVLDRGGRLVVARRAGWMTFDDLRRFCGRRAWSGWGTGPL